MLGALLPAAYNWGMIHLYREYGESTEVVGNLPPGTAGSYGEGVQDDNRLLLIGCFSEDCGGEIRLVEKDYYATTTPGQPTPPDLFEHTILLHTIERFGRAVIRLSDEDDEPSRLVAQHIPGHYN